MFKMETGQKIINKIKTRLLQNAPQSGEGELMVSVYCQGLEDYLRYKIDIRREDWRLNHYIDQRTKHIDMIRLYSTVGLPLTEARLDILRDACIKAQRFKTKITNSKRRIRNMRKQKTIAYKFLIDPKNKYLLICNIQPRYVIKLLSKVKFFEENY